MRLSDLRNYVRRQTQTVASELPDATIDAFLQEAFNRTIAAENQWPYYEKTWQIDQQIGQRKFTLPNDVNVPAITGLFSVEPDTKVDYRVELMSHVVAAEQYTEVTATSSARPRHFSVWAREVYLWPALEPTEVTPWALTGFRLPIDWIAVGPESEPDCDPRLHQALAHYAVALAYAQQEDETLESTYMQRWQLDVEAARGAIMEPSQDRPLVMGPHRITPIGPRRGRWWPGRVRLNS